MEIIRDHNGAPARHGRATVNGVRLHYVVAGDGDPLVLLHGVPKTSYYWRRVIPLLSSDYTVIAPDLRGLGDSQHARDGYDMRNIAEDIAQLASHLGYERFNLGGEDWGAAAAYQLAARYPERVTKLIFQEMVLPGFGLEDSPSMTGDNVVGSAGDPRKAGFWHISFYSVPDVPELLIAGKEREFFSWFIKNETFNPQAVDSDALDEYIRCYSSPGGVRCMCELYRATLVDAEQNRESAKTKLTMPVLAVGGEYQVGAETERQMCRVAENVRGVLLPWGHQLAEEDPEGLSSVYRDFLRT